MPVIDRESCIHFRSGACGLCAKVCQAGAIDYDQPEETMELEVGSVVLTPGFEAFDATRRGEFGFGFAPNVLTNVQFERLLSASGPTGGRVLRPTDGKAPKRMAFIQCVGSRDTGCDNDYCSSVCCMAATKEAILAKEHEPGLDVTIFFLDLRAFGKDFDRYCERAQKQLGVRYVRSFISRTYEMPGTKNLRLVYAGPEMKQVEEEFDMIVLSLGLEPSATLQEQAQRMGVLLNRWGFAQTEELRPLDTSRPGVFVGGAFQEPKDIPDTVMQASAAAARAMELLALARGSRVRVKTYPPERDISDEPPRVGVFVCHCGSNIASVVDVERVVKETQRLPYVIHAERNMYTCADDSQDRIKAMIAEHRLNRVVVASCTPRTHEPIFRDTLRDAGLNPFLLEMANIRDQCSWVHSGNPDKATEKAIDLVRMAVGRTARLMPLQQEMAPVNNAALIIGGGVAGMTAALALAGQGFPVHLAEKDAELGGTARQLHHTLDGRDIQAFLADTIRRVTSHPRITVYLNSRWKSRRPRRQLPLNHQQRFRLCRNPTRRNRRGNRGNRRKTAFIWLRPKSPGNHATGTGRPLGTRRDIAARECHGGNDPMRGATQRRTAVLQPRVLHIGRQELAGIEKTLSASQDHSAIPRHADLRISRGGLSRSPGKRSPVCALRARAGTGTDA